MDEKKSNIKDKLHAVKEFILTHSKIMLPLILVVCILVTVVVAVNANRKDKLEREALEAAAASETQAPSDSLGAAADEIEIYELEENAYPEICNAVRAYYDAQANGDVEVISSMNSYLNDIEKLRLEQLSKYIDTYVDINVYTKPGMSDNSYVAYVTSNVKFTDMEKTLPGMQAYYIEGREDGGYNISDGTYDETVYDYIKKITLQDDVVVLNNKVASEYNSLISDDVEMNEFVAYLKEKINEEVGTILAQAETTPENQVEEKTDEVDTEDDTPVPTVVSRVRATDRVNIRKSDSAGADKLGSASVGEEFTLIEKLGNGWTKVKYQDGEAFIKTEYLEDVEDAVTVEFVSSSDNVATPDTSATKSPAKEETKAEATTNTKVNGKVKVTDGVRVRKEPNVTADILGTVYAGDEFDFIETTGDWTKVKYKKNYGYIKSDYVEKVQ